MHDDSETPLSAEWSTDDQDSTNDAKSHNRDDPTLPNLDSWHVLEIDGEATAVSGVDAPPEPATDQTNVQAKDADDTAAWNESVPRPNPIQDKLDNGIVTSIDLREQSVEAGETAHYQVTVLNNAERMTAFELHTEGWVKEDWVAIAPTHTRLQPGESTIFDVSVTPPRLPACRAGEKPFAIIARSPENPKSRSQLGARLIIQPYTAFTFAELRPSKLDTSWHNRSAATILPVTNHSNVKARVILAGHDRDHSCRFDFTTAQTNHRYAAAAFPERPMLTLEPGQTQYVPVRVTPDAPTLFGLRRERTPFRITGWIMQANNGASTQPVMNINAAEQMASARMVNGHLARTPLVGPGIMTMLASCLLVLGLSVGTIGLFTLLALYPSGVQRLATPTAIVDPAAPPVEIVVKIAEPIPTNPTGTHSAFIDPTNNRIGTGGPAILPAVSLPVADGSANQAGAAQPEQTEQPAPSVVQQVPAIPVQRAPQSGDGIVIVQPNMVSQPGDVAPAQPQPIQAQPAQVAPVVAASNANPATGPMATMTYEQLFRTVGTQYDIDWRVLAAQAYVESGFNPLALGGRGDLGLMQVLPSTWKEWAPRMDVADPFDTYSNVIVAAAYLDYVRTTFSSQGYTQEEWMLIAYNWGPNQLRGFLNEGKDWDDLAPARQKYARDILRIAESLPLN